MANLGLLGALGGLGTGLQTAGQTLFNNEIDKDRELRLEAIRSREYARARADQVADLDRILVHILDLFLLQPDRFYCFLALESFEPLKPLKPFH